MTADEWEVRDAHPWVGKACGVEQLGSEDRVGGVVLSVEGRGGGLERVNVEIDAEGGGVEVLNTDPDRVEVIG